MLCGDLDKILRFIFDEEKVFIFIPIYFFKALNFLFPFLVTMASEPNENLRNKCFELEQIIKTLSAHCTRGILITLI